jgi:L-serine dehydratase
MFGVFDLFRIGIGPSSSHTVGPMLAAARFVREIPAGFPAEPLRVELFGSLALTGKGHTTDTAVVLGLLQQRPDKVDPDQVSMLVAGVAERKEIGLPSGRVVAFDPAADIVFLKRGRLPRHPNGMRFTASNDAGAVFSREYYSVGGGFIVTDEEADKPASVAGMAVPYPFATADELLSMAEAAGLSIAELQRANEQAFRADAEISAGIAEIWEVMRACVARGLRERGELRVRRRAPGLYARLLERHGANELDVLQGMDWVNLFALAVNEENAGGGGW